MSKCAFCDRPPRDCDCWSFKPAAAPSDSDENFSKNGWTWCGRCTCRILRGRCSNTQCSTNRR